MRLRVAVRLLSIQRALVRHGLDDFIRATHLYRPFRFLFYLSPWTWFQRSEGRTRGERLRLALEELGPIFVKFGQAVSTRRDLIPADIADELVRLQDRVPPFPGDVAAAAVEEALGAGLAEIFSSFDRTALAAASIAQVHAATLLGGEDVVVKILRPGMHEIIDLDLEVMDALAALADQYWVQSRRLRPTELVREYRKTILDELDLMREAANAAQLKRNFSGSNLLYVPRVYWDHCRTNVMVMERIKGIVVSRLDELRARGTNIAKLAENGVEIFFTQVFRHNFFHADMHPGNIFVQIDDPALTYFCDRGLMSGADTHDERLRRDCNPGISTTSPRISSRSSPATTPGSRPCTSNRAGCRGEPASTNWSRPCARCASRSSTSPSRRYPSRRCCCGCSRSRAASTWKYSRS